MTEFSDVPGTAAPLHRALENAGYSTLESLDGVPYKTLIALHGVGKTGLGRIQAALLERGLSLGKKQKAPPSPQVTPVKWPQISKLTSLPWIPSHTSMV